MHVTKNIPPLPPNKTIVDVFADFLAYLYNSVLAYLTETHYNGPNLSQYEQEFVITHPNGWEGAQQYQLRRAAVLGGLIPDTDTARSRIHFVTEGEAGLNFCIRQRLLVNSGIQDGKGVLVIDAGGGTVDMSAYGRKPSSEEVLYHEI
ncbi:hypothetical protein C0991_000971, partial [Blastosporella zonata]